MRRSRDEIKALLAEARDAYHRLAIGGAVKVFVDQNGERIEYSSVSIGSLQKYITMLENELRGCPAGPLEVWM